MEFLTYSISLDNWKTLSEINEFTQISEIYQDRLICPLIS